MDLLSLLVVFMMGILTGAVGIVMLTLFLGKRAMDKKKSDSADKRVSISSRMKRVKEITNEQLELAGIAETPQKNSLDGKYKNSLISKMKVLDEEKNNILRSILEDGYDPELTTMDSSGVVSQMKLSEYMAHMGISFKSAPKTAAEIKSEKMSKFTVYKGGREEAEEDFNDDDDGGTIH